MSLFDTILARRITIHFREIILVRLRDFLIWQLTRSRHSVFNYPSYIPWALHAVAFTESRHGRRDEGLRVREENEQNDFLWSRFRDGARQRDSRENCSRGFPRWALMELSLAFAIGGSLSLSLSSAGVFPAGSTSGWAQKPWKHIVAGYESEFGPYSHAGHSR